jgi:outer membrane protein OmpA-like peptidoglycan-associated protein
MPARMRNRVLILVGLLSAGLCRIQAHAQVTYDPRALDQLNHSGPAAPATPPPLPATASTAPDSREPATSRRPTRRTAEPTRREATTTAHEATEPTGKIGPRRGTEPFGPPRPPPMTAGTLTVPPAPPPAVVIPPPVQVPVRPAPPPIPAVVSDDAAGDAVPIKDGIRITFGADSSDLNPKTEDAIKSVLRDAPKSDATTFAVTAFAAGTPDDPSTARRVSLSRALAVRSVMIEQGIPSVRIYVKALGSTAEPGPPAPPDRVDIAVAAPPPGTGSKPP